MLPESERLTFRELTPDDLDFVAAMVGDPEVMRFYPQVLDRAGAAEWLARQRRRYERDGSGLWLVGERETGEPIGQVGLIRQYVDGVPEPEIGYLVHRPFWRRGYAHEAAAAVRDHAFGSFGERSVISLIRPVNVPSQRVALRIGMKPERLTTFADLEHLVFRIDATATTD